MNIEYDKIADAAYIRIAEGSVAKTVRLNENLLIDKDDADSVLGIEILDASTQANLIENLGKEVDVNVPIALLDHVITVS